jgi:hypothetical protein
MRGSSQGGQILPIFCLMLALLILPVGGLAVDGGVLLSSHASLVGAAQAAAEAAAQAIDVTALEDTGAFQLCTVPDGGASCANGIGTVGQVVADATISSYPASRSSCINYGTTQLPSSLPPGSGCAFDAMSNCARPGDSTSVAAPQADGVRVVIWQTIQLPLLVFPGWSSVQLRASDTAWMEHGFASQAASTGVGGTSC